MNEENTKLRLITPAIEKSGWDKHSQIDCEYFFTDGRIIVQGNSYKRGKRKKVDYLLSYKKNIPLAVVEAKDTGKTIQHGMQQGLEYAEALEYAKTLDVPFVYSSNGKGFLEHDRLTGKERELAMDNFPSPEELWNRFKSEKLIDNEKENIITQPYYFKKDDKLPRYYQRIAINRTIEAIANGQDRILLVMATGTGKTFTAFQIIYRLYNAGVKKKILYLADRNVLIDQTIGNDFKPFKKVITKVQERKLDSAYEIYMSLYQQLSTNDEIEIFTQFKPDFFDLIVVDECHRGSAKDDSNWRRILEYFSSATQIGLTATPKETKDVSNKSYFGEPIYTYSLKQGIEDGFLAPYKVIRFGLNTDLEGYRPEKGKTDIFGNEIEDREYTIKDYDKILNIKERTREVAKIISDYLKKTDRFQKTIIFCIDIDHAERMRSELINENSDLIKENSKYIMKITGDDKEGKAQLDNFIDEDQKFPTIVTTSKLMTTGVDCKTCKLIVLDNNINSMTEFKQIIGRGTRIQEDCGKVYFTIIDFRNSTRLFSDPDFDGEPVQIKEIELKKDKNIIDDIFEEEFAIKDDINKFTTEGEIDGERDKRQKTTIDGVKVNLISQKEQFLDNNGKLITENLLEYNKNKILEQYPNYEAFLEKWNSTLKKDEIINELFEQQVLLENSENLDYFDLICEIAYNKKPLTRAERAKNIDLNKYPDNIQKVLEILLEHYVNEGIDDLGNTQILQLKFENRMEIIKSFGGKEKYLQTILELEKEIYK